jgi:hypothetical protein
MPTITAKLKGTFKLGDAVTGKAFEAQVSNIGVPQTVSRDAPVTVLTGDVIHSAATLAWSITGTVLLDLSDPTGVYYFVLGLVGTDQPFEFAPIGAEGPTITGICSVDGWNTEELAAGAIVSSKFTWPVQGQITTTPPGGP